MINEKDWKDPSLLPDNAMEDSALQKMGKPNERLTYTPIPIGETYHRGIEPLGVHVGGSLGEVKGKHLRDLVRGDDELLVDPETDQESPLLEVPEQRTDYSTGRVLEGPSVIESNFGIEHTPLTREERENDNMLLGREPATLKGLYAEIFDQHFGVTPDETEESTESFDNADFPVDTETIVIQDRELHRRLHNQFFDKGRAQGKY